MKGFEINENVLSMIVCGGSFDLFHLCHRHPFVTPNQVCKASEFFHLPLLVFLLENGADLNAKDEDIWTPLHFAAVNGHLSVVQYLVNQKADINAKNKDIEFLYLIILLFIMLLILAIFMLLNFWLFKKLI